MNIGHKLIQQYIKKRYGHLYNINCEAVDGKNYLPSRKDLLYQPDVIITDKRTKAIRFIVEVECDPMRKVLVGASILADYTMGQLKQATKPKLVFVVYTEAGIKQISSFKKRVKMVEKYCDHLENISICSEKEFKKHGL